jgi:hypothetical protein
MDQYKPARRSRVFPSKFPSICRVCQQTYAKGDPIVGIGDHLFAHAGCAAPEPYVAKAKEPRRLRFASDEEADVEVNIAPPAGPWRN